MSKSLVINAHLTSFAGLCGDVTKQIIDYLSLPEILILRQLNKNLSSLKFSNNLGTPINADVFDDTQTAPNICKQIYGLYEEVVHVKVNNECSDKIIKGEIILQTTVFALTLIGQFTRLPETLPIPITYLFVNYPISCFVVPDNIKFLIFNKGYADKLCHGYIMIRQNSTLVEICFEEFDTKIKPIPIADIIFEQIQFLGSRRATSFQIDGCRSEIGSISEMKRIITLDKKNIKGTTTKEKITLEKKIRSFCPSAEIKYNDVY